MTRTIWIMLVCLVIPQAVLAASPAGFVKKGSQLYHSGDFPGSIDKFKQALDKDPESDIINYDIGTAYYKNKEFDNALQHLRKSLLTDNPQLKENGHFNLGNAFYKFGLGQEGQDMDLAITSLEQSLAQYEAALKIHSEDADAKYNYEYVKKELERLKKKRQEQQKQCPRPQSGGKSSQENQQKENQQQNQQQNQQSQQEKPQQQKESQSPQEQKNEQSQQTAAGQEEKDQQDQSNEAQDSTEEKPTSRSAPNAAAIRPGQMTEKEAQMLINNYEQTEEPKGLLNFMKNKAIEQPVLKDW